MKMFRWLLILLFACWLVVPSQAADTVQDFSAVFTGGGNAPFVIASGTGPIEIIEEWDGKALRLTQAINDQQNGVAFNQMVSGAYSKLELGFDMQFSLFDPPGSGGADGYGFVYANSALHGSDNSNTIIPAYLAEEPNLSGSIGVGFDIWTNDDQGDAGAQNSVSLHFDGNRLASSNLDLGEFGDLMTLENGVPLRADITVVPVAGGSNVTVKLLDTDTALEATPFENFFVSGLQPYDGRVVLRARTGGANSEQIVDNITLKHTPTGGGAPFTFTEKFEAFALGQVQPPAEPAIPPLVSGTPFSIFQGGPVPGPRVINDGGATGAQPGHAQLTAAANSLSNSVAFDQTSDVADNIQAKFSFKVDNGGAADGFSMLILDANTYLDTGPLTVGFSEDPNLAGALSVGFDIYDNDEEANPAYIDPVDPTGCGAGGPCSDSRANHVSLHWNGALVGLASRLDRAEFDMVNGNWNDVTVLASEVENGMNVTVVIEDVNGNTFVPLSDVFVEGASFPDGARIAFGARTGGANAAQRIDNVNVKWTGGAGLPGDHNANGSLDAGDLDLQAAQMVLNPVPPPAGYDLNNDNVVNFGDRLVWLHDLKKTWVGDSDLNGQFTSDDFVLAFQAGKYEVAGAAAKWEQGDWNGDQRFTSDDFVSAFADGGYEAGPRAAVSAVPEPSSLALVLLGLAGLLGVARRR